jgi:hypothetical protein
VTFFILAGGAMTLGALLGLWLVWEQKRRERVRDSVVSPVPPPSGGVVSFAMRSGFPKFELEIMAFGVLSAF